MISKLDSNKPISLKAAVWIHSLTVPFLFAGAIKCLLTGVNGSLPFSTASMFLIANSSNPM